MTTGLPSKILIVDDDPSFALGLEGPLKKQGVRVQAATNLETAMYYFNQQRFEVAVVELEFGPLNGLALIQKWREHDVKEKRFTGFVVGCGTKRKKGDEALLKELGALEFITKPFGHMAILPFLNRALERRDQSIKFDQTVEKLGKLEESGKSVEHILSYIKKNFENLGAHGVTMLCEVLEKHGEFEQALDVVEMVIAKLSGNNLALIGRKGRLLLKLGRFEEAREYLETANEEAPNNINRLESMTNMYLETGDGERSLSTMKELVNLSPESPDLKFDMFENLFMYGHEQQAMRFCHETAPPHEVVRFYNNKGVAYAKSDDSEQAIAEYKKALKYYPDHKETYKICYNIALSYYNALSPDLRRAQSFTNQCLSLNPEFDKALRLKAAIERSVQKPTKSA